MICFMSDFWLSDLKLLKGTFFLFLFYKKFSFFFLIVGPLQHPETETRALKISQSVKPGAVQK